MDCTTNFFSSIRHERLERLNPTFQKHIFYGKTHILFSKNASLSQTLISNKTHKKSACGSTTWLRKEIFKCGGGGAGRGGGGRGGGGGDR